MGVKGIKIKVMFVNYEKLCLKDGRVKLLILIVIGLSLSQFTEIFEWTNCQEEDKVKQPDDETPKSAEALKSRQHYSSWDRWLIIMFTFFKLFFSW